MDDRNFNLLPQDQGAAPRRPVARNVALIALLTLTLVLGAFYAPLLINNTRVTAAPAAQTPVTLPAVPAITQAAAQDQEALAQLYSAIAPSVVSIEVAARASASDFQIPGLPNDQLPNLPQLPGQNGQQGESDQLVPQGEGSGWIFDEQGHIVTNNHVVDGADQVTVIFYDGTWAEAEVVATDPQADLAVLKVTPPDGFAWRPLSLAANDSLKVGYSVIAIGNPFGLESTITTGIVSALGRSFPVGSMGENRYTLPNVIQTDAAINPGNSGGPLVNMAGEVVGVNFAIESGSGSNSGVGFAIPVSIVEKVVPALISDGKYAYPYLGLSGTSVTPTLARTLGLGNTQLGAYVAAVIEGGPAAAAGLVGADPNTEQGGDLITSFNGARVRSFDELVGLLVTTTAPGDKVQLGVLRDGEQITVDLTVGQRPGATQAAQSSQNAPSEPNGQNQQGPVTARQAIVIAREQVQDQLNGDISSMTVTPDDRNGTQVWVVELGTDAQTATVVIGQATGEVLEVQVK